MPVAVMQSIAGLRWAALVVVLAAGSARALESTPRGSPDRLAREAIESARAEADRTISANSSDLEQAKKEISRARNDSEARRIAVRYVHAVNRRSNMTAKSIRRTREMGTRAVAANGGDRELVEYVRKECNDRLNEVRNSQAATVNELTAGRRRTHTQPRI